METCQRTLRHFMAESVQTHSPAIFIRTERDMLSRGRRQWIQRSAHLQYIVRTHFLNVLPNIVFAVCFCRPFDGLQQCRPKMAGGKCSGNR